MTPFINYFSFSRLWSMLRRVPRRSRSYGWVTVLDAARNDSSGSSRLARGHLVTRCMSYGARKRSPAQPQVIDKGIYGSSILRIT